MFKELIQKRDMPVKRVVSFLPSATELIYSLGADNILFGVTHECNYPENAKTKPIVISSIINSENLSSNEIDSKTCQLLQEKKDIFVLNPQILLKANPDLIISQEICNVCAAHSNQVDVAKSTLEKNPLIYLMNQHNLADILETVTEMGILLEKESEASIVRKTLESRINNVKNRSSKTKNKILVIEWLEPFFTAGHWIPEMIQIAGGVNLISQEGQQSRRLSIEEISDSDPDIIILMPCGFNLQRSILEYEKILKNNKKWNTLRAVKNKNIFVLDADSYFSKASIRTITGLEILAKIIQPKQFSSLKLPENSYYQVE